MNRKAFTILIAAIFLIASVGFISAADTSDDSHDSSKTISVKIQWNGDSQNDRPDSVTVNLIKDGKIVDSASLNDINSWAAKFTVSEDGSYSINQVGDLSDYSVSTSGSVSSGFVITNTLNKEVLGVTESEDALQENGTDDNATDDNSTDNNQTEDKNSTIPEDNDDDDPSADDDTKSPNTKKTQSKDNPDVKKVEKKVIKKEENKKPKNVTKAKLRHTGIPIIGVVVIAFVAAFVPFSRKK